MPRPQTREGRAPARPQTREGRAPARPPALTTLKQRLDQPLPADAARFAEIVLSIGHLSGRAVEAALAPFAGLPVRLALPVFTHERDVPALRTTVKHLLRAGYARWEASDLATLHLLRQVGVSDISSDWTLYAFNRAALAELADLGVVHAVASPENSPDNQSTPLFISITPPATGGSQLAATANTGGSRSCATVPLTSSTGTPFTTFPLDGLWITTRAAPRRFTPPADAPRRLDLSWDPVF